MWKKENKENGEERLAKLILNKTSAEDCFDIEHKGKTLKLGVRPLSGRRLVEVSEQLSKCSNLEDNGQSVFHALMENASNLKYVCKAIAIATEAKNLKKTTEAIYNLELSQIETLWNIVVKNSDASFFFSIMNSAKNLNLMKKKKEA